MGNDEWQQVVEDYSDWLNDETTLQIMAQWPDNPYVKRTFDLMQRMAGLCSEVADKYNEWQKRPNGMKGLIDAIDKR